MYTREAIDAVPTPTGTSMSTFPLTLYVRARSLKLCLMPTSVNSVDAVRSSEILETLLDANDCQAGQGYAGPSDLHPLLKSQSFENRMKVIYFPRLNEPPERLLLQR